MVQHEVIAPELAATMTIYIVDDEETVRNGLRLLVKSAGLQCELFATAQQFLVRTETPLDPGCLLLDVHMPGMSGLALQEQLQAREIRLPVIMLTGHADVPMAVRAMKGGALDFFEKPFDPELLLARIRGCLDQANQQQHSWQQLHQAKLLMTSLTPREREVMAGMVEGLRNKQIAARLAISPRTVELHRASLMTKLQVRNLSEVVRLALLVQAH